MLEVTGMSQSIVEKFFERVKSMSRIALCCVLVYFTIHMRELLPAKVGQYLEMPQEVIPWINLAGVGGCAWLIVELLATWLSKLHQRLTVSRKKRMLQEKARREREIQEAANRECEEIMADPYHVLHETLLLFLCGHRVVELNAMMPEVVCLIKKNIIMAISDGYLTCTSRHMCSFSLTPWITEYVAKRMLDAKMGTDEEKSREEKSRGKRQYTSKKKK